MRYLAFVLLFAVGCETHADDDWPEHCPDPDSPRVHYMHETWEERDICYVIDYVCDEGEEYINGDDCGCGCIEPVF